MPTTTANARSTGMTVMAVLLEVVTCRRTMRPMRAPATESSASDRRGSVNGGGGRLDALHQHRHALPARDTQRGDAVAALHPRQLGEQRDHDARAAAAGGMAERNAAA